MSSNDLITIILAGGLGKRMLSETPKVLHIVKDKPMICHVIDRALELNTKYILVIVGKYKQLIQETILIYYSEDIHNKIIFITQPEPLGTGNAVYCCIDWLNNYSNYKTTRILILSGDVPLITKDTLYQFININSSSNCILTYELEDPKGYGRIIIDNLLKSVKEIIEEKDCSEKQLNINIVNCGIYCLDYNTLVSTLPYLTNNNASGEYYLTDMISLSYNQHSFIPIILPKERHIEMMNINTKEDLENINKKLD